MQIRNSFFYLGILFSLLFNVQKLYAQNPNGETAIGIEQDVLPYFLKGFIGTVWVGQNKTRVRFAYAHATSPDLFLPDGLTNNQTRAFGFGMEQFFKPDFKGFWLGPNIGYWHQFITESETGTVKKWESFILSVGAGYNWYVYKGLYLSPWLAAHFRVSGNKEFMVGSTPYTPWLVTPEVSIKIGYRFKVPSS